MNRSRVFVVQNPQRYDPHLGELVARYDLRPAEKFGKLKFILTRQQTLGRMTPRQLISKMDLILATYTSNDHLLLIGSPVLIGWATVLAAKHSGGNLSQLVWSGSQQDYDVVKSYLPLGE